VGDIPLVNAKNVESWFRCGFNRRLFWNEYCELHTQIMKLTGVDRRVVFMVTINIPCWRATGRSDSRPLHPVISHCIDRANSASVYILKVTAPGKLMVRFKILCKLEIIIFLNCQGTLYFFYSRQRGIFSSHFSYRVLFSCWIIFGSLFLRSRVLVF